MSVFGCFRDDRERKMQDRKMTGQTSGPDEKPSEYDGFSPRLSFLSSFQPSSLACLFQSCISVILGRIPVLCCTIVMMFAVLVRLEARKSAMRLLIDALPSDAGSISQPAVKSLLVLLLSATHADDVSHSSTLCRRRSSINLPPRRRRQLLKFYFITIRPRNLAS